MISRITFLTAPTETGNEPYDSNHTTEVLLALSQSFLASGLQLKRLGYGLGPEDCYGGMYPGP